MSKRWMVIAVCMTLGLPGLAATQSHWKLAIGDPARKGKEVPVTLDTILDTRTGASLTPAELATKLDDVKVVFVGESHTDMFFHRAQLQVIQALKQRGRDVLIGLEMYPYTEQAGLDLWNSGKVTEDEFVERSGWYRNWGYHWGYYRDIFAYARRAGIRMYGVNTPREVVSAVRKKGFQNLTPEEAAHIPATIDVNHDEHKQLFRAFFADENNLMHTMSGAMFDAMFAAQCTWDATMGFNAINALKAHGDASSIMVVLIGSGHVAYGLGIQRQSATWFNGKMASVIPIAVADTKGTPLTSVQASYADFVWGIPPESDPIYPSLGFSTRSSGGESPMEIIDVPRDSVAATAGFKVGDVLLTVDGQPLTQRDRLNQVMAGKQWADSAVFTVRRGADTVTVTAYFRRVGRLSPESGTR